VDIALTGTCAGGNVNLHRYPGLTYAPKQHGEGIRLAATGAPVADVAAHPELVAAVATLKMHADALRISLADLCDAVRFVEDAKAGAA
jgi:hypothetical protein